MRSVAGFLSFSLFISIGSAQKQEAAQAYVPMLTPLVFVEAVYPDAAREQKVTGSVHVLLTLDAKGNVSSAEPLEGPALLRPAAIDAAKQLKFQPVIRDGHAVAAYTDRTVYFIDGQRAVPSGPSDRQQAVQAYQRLSELGKQFSRSAEQALTDLEQDSKGGDERRRANVLERLAGAAVDAGKMDKAETYARELLASELVWSRGNAVHTGNIVLGRIALSHNDLATARERLLAAGKTEGSPQLNSFGPNMMLAKELLDKGEKDVVLAYFDLCRKFWKRGEPKLNDWSDVVRAGHTPDFGANLRY